MTIKEKNALQKEVVDSLDLNPKGLLLLAPRIGKTKIGIDIIKKNKPKSILWVTLSPELAAIDIPLEFNTWKASKYLKCLTVSTWASLSKVTGEFDMIILDEIQFITIANSTQLVSRNLKGKSIIGMTGTYSKDFIKNQICQNIGLPILYEISINNAVELGLLSNYQINVVEVSLSEVKDIEVKTKAGGSFMTSEKSQYSYLNEVANDAMTRYTKDVQFKILARRRAIQNSPSKLHVMKLLWLKLTGRILCFCPTIATADSMTNFVYHSKSDNTYLKQFQDGSISQLALVNSGGTGFTYKKIDHLIITQCDSDKNGMVSQKICRALLKQKNHEPIVWIICLKSTRDEEWVKSSLANFDPQKIKYINVNQIFNED